MQHEKEKLLAIINNKTINFLRIYDITFQYCLIKLT